MEQTAATPWPGSDDVPVNHMSPMGQIDSMGRFTRGVGSTRVRRIFRIGLALVTVSVVIRLATEVFG